MISKRLRTIGDLISDNESVTDVGCDHGYLAIYLRQKGNTSRIICGDSKEGPLSQGRKNFAEAGFNDIETVLSDGLKQIDTVTDVIVMAGMGYHTVIDIMTASEDKFAKADKVIIQVNTDVDKMRKWLNENEYAIIDEKIIKEYKYYEILVVRKGIQKLSEEQIKYGPVLLKEKSEVFLECYSQKARKLERIIGSLSDEHLDRPELQKQLDNIRKWVLE